nr:PepSY-associated TM helix domain-containing protein [Caldimonas mangrovi]
MVHRWVGLALAGFLLLAGLTGALLTWYEELDAWASPQLLRVAPPALGAAMLSPLALREKVQAEFPQAYVPMAYLRQEPGHAAVVRLFGRPDPVTGELTEPSCDQVFVNPYTGQVLGERKWGDITQGLKNLMPFIYRLHYSLALDAAGSTLLGIVALLWTLDCFVGAWLTLPATRMPAASRGGTTPPSAPWRGPVAAQRRRAWPVARQWLVRWGPSWKLRLGSGAYKISFDLHRAGGLWTWAVLFVLAWSSVAFNLHDEVYDPVMRALFAYQPERESLPRPQRLDLSPALVWDDALATGRRLMAEQARRHRFTVHDETLLVHDPRVGLRGTWRYQVRSSRDIRDRWGSTQVIFDAETGELLQTWLPTGAARGDTIRTWLTSLHMAMLGGTPFRLFMTVMGLGVAMLSITGVLVWARKRHGRVRGRARSRAALPSAH